MSVIASAKLQSKPRACNGYFFGCLQSGDGGDVAQEEETQEGNEIVISKDFLMKTQTRMEQGGRGYLTPLLNIIFCDDIFDWGH